MRNIDDYTKKYIEEDFEVYQAKYRKKMLLTHINKFAHKKILEISVGMDPLFNYIDDYESYTFIEPSELFFENAIKEALDNRITGVKDFFYATEELKNKHFDCIICSGLLHEVENPQQMLKDIYAICDNDTMVYLNVPNAKSLHRLIAFENGLISDVHDFSQRNERLQQHSVFDIDSFSELICKNGFEIVEKGSYFPKVFTHNQMLQLLKNNIIDEKILDGFYHLAKYIPDYGSEIFVDCKIKR